ncbi:uncharacterized protein BDR25DRAFT_339697 [Lindgomyces ingoldianus]|uniref:Uncharacterized protein n=1 Tax=Lindgomyces ingoldianus TaxID=673940 RepID=A0ACB6R8R5_9PLEO|nr:uncharacterized protein BDR25DRAFT_339697 [Lindgomyces ingoldianus]KAF2475644.1 hypothetical protein BDR25DRAFT_339697 [Lindgomyces ingoldianus]
MAQRRQWSTGCHACRKSKVKCDEAKPGCERCRRGGRMCPGYRDDSDMLFRNMTMTTVAVRTTDAGASQQSATTAVASSSTPVASTRTGIIQPVMLPLLRTDWDQQSIAFYFFNFCSIPLRDRTLYLEFLPEMAAKAPREGCLLDALSATAMVYMANISNLEHLRFESRKRYGMALKSLARALGEEREKRSVGTLTAGVLLQNYEVYTGATKDPWGPHEGGLNAIIEMRKGQHLDSPIGQSLSRLIQARRQIESLDAETTSAKSSSAEIQVFGPIPVRAHIFLLLRSVSLISGRIRAGLQELRAGTTSTSGVELNKAIESALLIKDQLLSWPESLPADWKYETLPAPSLSPTETDSDRPFPPKFIIFRDIHQSALWIAYWCSLIALLQTLIKVLPFHQSSSHSPSASLSLLRASLLSTIDDVSAATPYMLGTISPRGTLNAFPPIAPHTNNSGLSAFFLMRALHVCNFAEGVELDNRRRKWILDALLKIGYAKGIRLALRSRKRWIDGNPRWNSKGTGPLSMVWGLWERGNDILFQIPPRCSIFKHTTG